MSGEGDFQVLNMKYKLKKIKRKKSEKPMTRYQINNIGNIETFDILKNTTDNDLKGNAISKEVLNNKNGPIIEGLSKDGISSQSYRGITEDDWEGGDDVISVSGEEETISQQIKNMIDNIYSIIITLNCLVSVTLVNNIKNKNDSTKLSSDLITWNFIRSNIDVEDKKNPIKNITNDFDNDTLNDVNAIYNHICMFELFIITYIIIYTWFYLIFYCYANDIKNTSIFDYISRDYLGKQSNPIIVFSYFFLEYGVLILDDTKWLMTEFIPSNTIYLGKALCFCALFISLFFINRDLLFTIKEFITGLLTLDFKKFYIILIYIIVFGTYLNRFNPFIKPNGEEANKSSSSDLTAVLMNSAIDYMSYSTPVMIMKFIREILRIIVIAFFSIPMGILLTIVYFIWITIVTNISNLFSSEIRNNIIQYIRADLESAIIKTDSASEGFFSNFSSELMNTFTYIFMFLFNHLPFIVFFIYAIVSISGGYSEIINKEVYNILLMFNILILVLTIVLFILYIFNLRSNSLLSLYETFILPPLDIFENMSTISFQFVNAFFIIMILSTLIHNFTKAAKEASKDGGKQTRDLMKSKAKSFYSKIESSVNKRIEKLKSDFGSNK